MGEAAFCTEHALNEQIARQIFAIQPENGPIMLILDRRDNCWPSDSEKFSSLNIDREFLKELCAKVDDGAEPVIAQLNNCSIVAAQLATERTNCGYIVLIMPQYSTESTIVNMDIIETLVSQIGLIARLIEKTNQLSELQIKQFDRYCSCASASS